MRIPTDAEILALHTKHSPTPAALDMVYGHCLVVRGITEQILNRADDVDGDLVRAGALLHDIGAYRLYDDAGELDHANYIRHGVLGHELLAEEGLPERICRFASHHTGVGISREEVIRQGLLIPPGDYMAETQEEAIVMYADKFHTKTVPPSFLTAAGYAARVSRFGADKVAAFEALREQFGDPDLASLSGQYRQPLAS
jgi:uncharacterized protein